MKPLGFLALLALVFVLTGSPGQAQDTPLMTSDDWIIDGQAPVTGEISITLDISPRPLVYGRVVDATIEVANGSTHERQIQVKALLGEVAHFVSGDLGARFENPEQPAQQRTLIWPVRTLPPGARGRVSFQFLVTWDASGDLYIQAEAGTPGSDAPVQVDHVQETPQYPGGAGGGFLAQYGFVLILFGFFVGVQFVIARKQRKQAAGGLGRALAMVGAAVLFLLGGTLIWESLEPLSWTQTSCEVLDVRYSVDTSTTTSNDQRRTQTTTRFYSGSLTLRYQGPDGPLVSSGFRKQPGIDGPGDLASFIAGTTLTCFYDPEDPAWVVVIRETRIFTMVTALLMGLVGAVLVWVALRKRGTDG